MVLNSRGRKGIRQEDCNLFEMFVVNSEKRARRPSAVRDDRTIPRNDAMPADRNCLGLFSPHFLKHGRVVNLLVQRWLSQCRVVQEKTIGSAESMATCTRYEGEHEPNAHQISGPANVLAMSRRHSGSCNEQPSSGWSALS